VEARFCAKENGKFKVFEAVKKRAKFRRGNEWHLAIR
jgi:hypothetical protein